MKDCTEVYTVHIVRSDDPDRIYPYINEQGHDFKTLLSLPERKQKISNKIKHQCLIVYQNKYSRLYNKGRMTMFFDEYKVFRFEQNESGIIITLDPRSSHHIFLNKYTKIATF